MGKSAAYRDQRCCDMRVIQTTRVKSMLYHHQHGPCYLLNMSPLGQVTCVRGRHAERPVEPTDGSVDRRETVLSPDYVVARLLHSLQAYYVVPV